MFEFEQKYKGIHNAFDAACAKIREMEESLRNLYATRFFMKWEYEDGSMKLRPVTEDYISNTYDLNDLDGDPIPQFFYCDTDGELYPVELGRRNNVSDTAFVYAVGDLIANGKVVGSVKYTDH